MRQVLVHYHLFKNAGSSIDEIMARNFPTRAIGALEGPFPWSTLGPEDSVRYVRTNPQCTYLTSHQLRLPIPSQDDLQILPVVMLRHPVDRFASVYEFERQQPTGTLSPSAAIARDGSLADFADWVIDPGATAVCRNFQAIHLSGLQCDMRHARASADIYRSALQQFDQLPVFGLVDSFEESMRCFQRYLEPRIGAIDLTPVRSNVSVGRADGLQDRLADIARAIGPRRLAALREVNSLDQLLYDEAERVFNSGGSRFRTRLT